MNRTPLLFLNVIVIATCGLIYELLAGTLSSLTFSAIRSRSFR
jgi:predicted membrane-bound spermidine synthase